MEIKEGSDNMELVGRIELGQECSNDWRQEQLSDPSIAPIIIGKEQGQRPSWQSIASRDIATNIYCSYCSSGSKGRCSPPAMGKSYFKDAGFSDRRSSCKNPRNIGDS